jgi:hypothetical protein
MTNNRDDADQATDQATPRQVPGDQPGDYGVAPIDTDGRFGAGEGDPIDQLTAPLDEDDDVTERLNKVALVNTEQPDRLEQAPDPKQSRDGR